VEINKVLWLNLLVYFGWIFVYRALIKLQIFYGRLCYSAFGNKEIKINLWILEEVSSTEIIKSGF
jgi:hypothetical protein